MGPWRWLEDDYEMTERSWLHRTAFADDDRLCALYRGSNTDGTRMVHLCTSCRVRARCAHVAKDEGGKSKGNGAGPTAKTCHPTSCIPMPNIRRPTPSPLVTERARVSVNALPWDKNVARGTTRRLEGGRTIATTHKRVTTNVTEF